MKKALFIFSLIAIMSVSAFAQNQEAMNPADTTVPIAFERQFFIYQLANKYNDPSMAKSALFNMLAIMPNNIAVMDSLALLYYDIQQYVPAALMSQDIVAIKPDDALATEIAAISFDNLGVKEKALNFYEKMYLNSNDNGVLYRMAFLQYELKRYTEATASVNILLENESSANQSVYFPKNENENQEISLLAASYRLKGMIEQVQGNGEMAKQNFNKALELAPDFAIVKQQLQELE